MDTRQQRGLEIAARCRIDRRGDSWLVPSQTGNGRYTVDLNGDRSHCSCPDHETRGVVCKHIFAVRYAIERTDNGDGTTTVTQRMQATHTVRRTYAQNWRAYNAAQTNEKDRFQVLLHDLCSGIQEPSTNGRGRPRIPLADAIFSATFKVYSTFSARRFISDLREAYERGFIARVPHFNSIFNYLENAALTPILRGLIAESSLPLRSVEVDFAVDSSGFTTSRFHRWFDHKYGKVRQEHDWVKVHVMTGVKTNIVTAVEIRERNANDCPLLPPLLASTAERFTVKELSADKQYAAQTNFEAADRWGVTPYIAFPLGTTGGIGGSFQRAYHYFCLNREEFLVHYHRRSNAESTFSMMKRKFGDFLRSKTDTSMVNEALCKVLCHNIVVLIHEMHELGIESTFWAGSTVAQEVMV